MVNETAILALVGAILPLVCLVCAFRAGHRRRLIDNLPTCKTTGVFIGLVELKGCAVSSQPIQSYLAGTACVYYQWTVAEHWSRTVTETYTDEKGRIQTRTRTESGWTTVDDGNGVIPFYLQDDCGVVLVRPGGAKIESATVFTKESGHPILFTTARGLLVPSRTPPTDAISLNRPSPCLRNSSSSARPVNDKISSPPKSPPIKTLPSSSSPCVRKSRSAAA